MPDKPPFTHFKNLNSCGTAMSFLASLRQDSRINRNEVNRAPIGCSRLSSSSEKAIQDVNHDYAARSSDTTCLLEENRGYIYGNSSYTSNVSFHCLKNLLPRCWLHTFLHSSESGRRLSSSLPAFQLSSTLFDLWCRQLCHTLFS